MARRNAALPVPEFSRWTRGRTGFRRERALARRDGLWISAGALRTATRVPSDQNAAIILLEAVGASGKSPPTPREAILMGRLLPDVWRRASEPPYLVFERAWETSIEALRPELAAFKGAGKALVELARSGREPHRNLLTVARLAALIAQEPDLTCQYISLALGRMALKAASERGIAREVEARLGAPSLRHAFQSVALGLPPPVRRAWRYVPRGPWLPVPPWSRRMGPLAADRYRARTLRACRRLYRMLAWPDQAAALRRGFPPFGGVFRDMPGVFWPLPPSTGVQAVETFASYRELRRAAREG